jgi:DNA-directed RNA polymerase specialized sigma24 family protein
VNKIYIEISNLSDKFRTMCFGLTKNKTDIDNAVQELFIYFLERPELVKKIYDKDGLDGITRYGAVVLRRALTSVRSPFYYQYKKYYTHLDSFTSSVTYDVVETGEVIPTKHLYNIPEEVVENIGFKKLDKIDAALGEMYWYDRKIFELYYYESNTLDGLAKKTGISRNSLFTTIDKVRTILKKKLSE